MSSRRAKPTVGSAPSGEGRRRRQPLSVGRRGFLGSMGTAFLGTALYGCSSRQRMLTSIDTAPAAAAGVLPPVQTHHFGICANCVNKCGFDATVEGHRVVKLDPNPSFPKSRSMLCAKGNAGVRVIHDPDRLKHPLIRVGARGEGKWRKASWEEALDLTARRLTEIKEKYGPHGMLFSSTEGFQEGFFKTFAQAYGTPNLVRHPSLCLSSGNVAFFATFGTVPEFDVEHAEYVIASGANRMEAFITPDTTDLMEGLRSGRMKMIYLDPRYTVTASKASEWLPIRPGADLAFYLAMAHVLVTEKLYDAEFVAKYTHGFEELVAHVVPYTPEWAAKECDIPANQIRRITREFAAAAPRALVYKGRRTSWYENDTEMRQAMAIVNVLAGNWDKKGGLLPKESIPLGKPELPEFPWPDEYRVDNMEERHPLAREDDGAYVELRQQVLDDDPYPVRGWMVYKQNPVHGLPDRKLTMQMIEKMDFLAVIDIIPTDTAWMADVILPESTYLERTDPVHGFHTPYPFLALRKQIVAPQFETLPCLDIVKGLAGRMGMDSFFNYTIDSYIETQLAKPGITLTDFDENGVWTAKQQRSYGSTLTGEFRFRTPSGKIEIANERLRRRKYDPLPKYRAPSVPTEGQLRLLPGKQAYFTHASNQNNAWLHELCPENELWIHSEEASKRGITSGQQVIVSSAVGKVTMQALVTEKIRRDCVHMPHGFGHRSGGLSLARDKGASDQDLLEARFDRITGNAALHETFVTVEPA